MFTSQTSFQDSIDGDDKDAELDSEEILGSGQKSAQSLTCYYALYFYQSTSLSLVDSSLPPEAEPELRGYISRRLSKGALLGGMGNIATVELSVHEPALGCYCCLLETDRQGDRQAEEEEGGNANYVVCFLGGSEKGLNLFRLELDKYVQGLQSWLCPEVSGLEGAVGPYLSGWYEDSVMHIQRVVQLVQDNVCFLLHAALSNTHMDITGADERTRTDICRFVKAASLQGLVQEESTAASLCTALSEDGARYLLIDCSEPSPRFTNAVSNRFCDGWVPAFLNAAEGGNPFLLRQILENFKLKAIQDMNNLKRFIGQAEMSHYALFRCAVFLRSCGNGDVLLQNARAEHSGQPQGASIVRVLEEFLSEPGD
ncbi:protein Njmu-R1 isoform X2 [Amia ocellicauda]|uniref:protein Njmu-R1 isoform X2 n=1 Tax=Amia ocellicauda TaxID=2972642 RepID=UPI00346428C5